MQFTAIFLLALSLTAAATGHGQSVSIRLNNEPIEKLFTAIQEQTTYSFVYYKDDLKNAKKINVNVENTSVEEVLKEAFKDQPLEYSIVDKAVVVKVKKVTADLSPRLWSPSLESPPITIRGRIVNEKGEPVAASVVVKGTNKGTTTDAHGNFELAEVESNARLIVSGVNIETFELEVNGKTHLALNAKTKIGESVAVEVVSSGYQDIPKERATGSFVKIDNELLNRKVSTNILDRIYEVTSGLQFEQKNNVVSQKSTINIRGLSTINGNPRPLIVVDGFPYDELRLNEINNINPNDIESITVLKDAAAASIWGTRAGNGVIIIKTKTGRFNQKTKVQFNGNTSILQRPDISYLPIISNRDAVQFEKSIFKTGYYNDFDEVFPSLDFFPAVSPVIEILLAQRRGDILQSQADERIMSLTNKSLIEDLDKYFLRKGINQQYSINVSGGSERNSYYASIGYDKNIGNVINNGYDRFTLRLDNSYKLIKNLEASGYISYTQSRTSSNTLFQDILPIGIKPVAPYGSLTDDDGLSAPIPLFYRLNYIDTVSFPGLLDWHYRPLDETKNNEVLQNESQARIGGAINYKIISGLSAEMKFQYDRGYSNVDEYHTKHSYLSRDLINQFMTVDQTSGRVVYPVPLGGILDFSSTEKRSWNVRGQINFSSAKGKNEITAIIGTEHGELSSSNRKGRWYGYDDDKKTFSTQINYQDYYFTRASFGSSLQIPNVNFYSGILNRLVSYYSNVAYTYDKRYTLSFSGRSDGANLFGVKTNDKWKPLWSTGIAWDISNERFYDFSFLSYLRLRATYGYNGNTKNTASTFATINYGGTDNYTGLPIAQLSEAPNPGLRWEKVKIANLGIDFSLRNKRVSGSVELYFKQGLDLISSISTDPTSGVNSFVGNYASIKGNGMDLSVNSTNFDREFKWTTSILFSYNAEKVASFSLPAKTGSLLGLLSFPNVGKPLYSIYSYRWAGLDPSNGDPRGYVADTVAAYDIVLGNSGGAPNTQPENLIYHGSSIPTFFGSVRNTFRWNAFSISFNVTYKLGYFFRRQSINYYDLFNNWSGHKDFANRWQKSGDETITNVPSLSVSGDPTRDQFYAFSQVLVEKGDHIRLQDARISYDVNKLLLPNLPFENVQIYVYANNLALLWKSNKMNIDPDFETYTIPNSKTISFGATVSF